MNIAKLGFTAAFVAALALGGAGCQTQAYCFSQDCGDAGTETNTGGKSTGSTGTGGECIFNCGTTSTSGTGTSSHTGGGGTGGCVPTGDEVCDGKDNDCNGKIDDVPSVNLNEPKNCGACGNSCYTIAGSNWEVSSVSCNAGKCSGTCAADYYDLDGDGLCEYGCHKVTPTTVDDKICDRRDDDCDGLIDEDVDLCTDVANCGTCGHACSLPHATPACSQTGTGTCDATNTQCTIQSCVCNGPNDCWVDLDKSAVNGCEYPCYPTSTYEICGDGIDNDCNGLIDEADDLSLDPQIDLPCYASTVGECGEAKNAGKTQCVSHKVVCVGALQPNEQPETCNGLDDDCDGQKDNNPIDVGGLCGGGSHAPCHQGAYQCQNGAKVCVGSVDPQPETCDGIDNDCDGTIDNNLTDVGAACQTQWQAPAGWTWACSPGVIACVTGVKTCSGAVGPTSSTDTCGVDANCDNTLTNQPDLQTDVHNCGACGNDCNAGAVHAVWACVAGQCTFESCQPGYYDNGGPGDAVAGDHKCGYACTFASAKETCNGKDDNCDGQIDETANLVYPTPSQVCGVAPAATAPECSSYDANTNPGGVSISCVSGAWQCTFHTAGVCNPTCAATEDACETSGPALDNNCNGLINEKTPNYGQPCASDLGKPPPGDGACRTTGTFVCATATTTTCSAQKDLSKVSDEICDGIDNDCDGLVDETYNNPGSNTQYFVKPAVTKVQLSGTWIYSYEASRPNATTVVPGTGNGYNCNGATCPGGAPTAPAGVTLDKTPACSQQGKIPWFNVTPIEAEQTCAAQGGHICATTEWQAACITKPPGAFTCQFGYAPNGAACTTALGPPYPVSNPTRFCNLGPTYDFDPLAAGDQNGLLVTGSPLLTNCYADWTTLLSNGVTNGKIFDITGNLREITKSATNTYPLMGGAFDTEDESGATCQFSFYTSDQNFQLYDLGFRCCFSQDPRIYTCGNSTQDGSETDVDCGGIACKTCASGQKCLVDSDCASGTCLTASKTCQ